MDRNPVYVGQEPQFVTPENHQSSKTPLPYIGGPFGRLPWPPLKRSGLDRLFTFPFANKRSRYTKPAQ